MWHFNVKIELNMKKKYDRKDFQILIQFSGVTDKMSTAINSVERQTFHIDFTAIHVPYRQITVTKLVLLRHHPSLPFTVSITPSTRAYEFFADCGKRSSNPFIMWR